MHDAEHLYNGYIFRLYVAIFNIALLFFQKYIITLLGKKKPMTNEDDITVCVLINFIFLINGCKHSFLLSKRKSPGAGYKFELEKLSTTFAGVFQADSG